MSCAKYGWNMPNGFGEEDKMSVVYDHDDDNDNDEQRTYFSGELKQMLSETKQLVCKIKKFHQFCYPTFITQMSVIIRDRGGGSFYWENN